MLNSRTHRDVWKRKATGEEETTVEMTRWRKSHSEENSREVGFIVFLSQHYFESIELALVWCLRANRSFWRKSTWWLIFSGFIRANRLTSPLSRKQKILPYVCRVPFAKRANAFLEIFCTIFVLVLVRMRSMRRDKTVALTVIPNAESSVKIVGEKRRNKTRGDQRQLKQIHTAFYVISVETGLTVWHDGAFKYLKNCGAIVRCDFMV